MNIDEAILQKYFDFRINKAQTYLSKLSESETFNISKVTRQIMSLGANAEDRLQIYIMSHVGETAPLNQISEALGYNKGTIGAAKKNLFPYHAVPGYKFESVGKGAFFVAKE